MQTQNQSSVTGKKSFGQTVAQSFKVMGGANVPNYSLYFLNPTKRNRAGEHETIVIPYIEIGRGSGCAVQFGDEYPTVGRKHAAIRFDSGKIILKQLHATNPTIVMRSDGTNQQLTAVGQEVPLENGQQIQFSMNGPIIRLNATPTATSKMGVTQRVQLALKQGIRPYRQGVAVLAVALVGLGLASAYFMNELSGENEVLSEQLTDLQIDAAQADQKVKEMEAAGVASQAEIKKARAEASRARAIANKAQRDADKAIAAAAKPKPAETEGLVTPPVEIVDGKIALAKYKPDIYYIFPKSVQVRHPDLNNNKLVDMTNDLRGDVRASWSGTAFLTDEGKLVTARHVITPWRFPDNCNDVIALIGQCELGGSVDATYSIIGPGGTEVESFTLSEVRTSATEDERLDNACPGMQIMRCPNNGMFTDWAWVNMNFKGSIKMNRSLSKNLTSGQQLEIYGYSRGLALQDLSRRGFDPLYGVCNVAQDGLPNKIIRVGNRPFTGGASGGPVFARNNGEYYAVGIISHGIDNIGGIVPVTHLK